MHMLGLIIKADLYIFGLAVKPLYTHALLCQIAWTEREKKMGSKQPKANAHTDNMLTHTRAALHLNPLKLWWILIENVKKKHTHQM